MLIDLPKTCNVVTKLKKEASNDPKTGQLMTAYDNDSFLDLLDLTWDLTWTRPGPELDNTHRTVLA